MKSSVLLAVFSAGLGAALTSLVVGDPAGELDIAIVAEAGNANLRAPGLAARGEDTSRLTPDEQVNIRVYEDVNRSVVNISTRSQVQDGFWYSDEVAHGSGSGAVLDQSGHILTNFHVVDGADFVEVRLANNQSYQATLVGADKIDDIAILKIDVPPSELNPIKIGDSSNLRVGQRVFAIGNPFGWDRTLTTGIISSLNRTLPSRSQFRTMKALIQTDAAMNPGNSGGPLLNTSSEMIGMNVAIATGPARQNSGVGFAIPAKRIQRIARELIDSGRVTRADIGIVAVVQTEGGLLVQKLLRGGAAERAGLRPIRVIVRKRQQGPFIYEQRSYDIENADLITAVGGEPVRTPAEFLEAVESHRPGDTVRIGIIRNGQYRELEVTLGAS